MPSVILEREKNDHFNFSYFFVPYYQNDFLLNRFLYLLLFKDNCGIPVRISCNRDRIFIAVLTTDSLIIWYNKVNI